MCPDRNNHAKTAHHLDERITGFTAKNDPGNHRRMNLSVTGNERKVEDMHRHRILISVVILALILGVPFAAHAQDASPQAATGSLTAVASGLTNPRGFAWSPDGTLYLALAGAGGDTRIPVVEGFTAVIGLSSSVVTVADGCTTPVVQGLVSTLWEEAGWVWGAMDVAFLGSDPYVLLSGAGPSWLSPSSFSGIFKINGDGTMTLVADITNWLPQHLPASIPPDYGADGSLFDLEAAGDSLLFSEAVGGQLIRVTPAGEISRVADLSEGHMVPTGIAVDTEGNAYVGFETTPPYSEGSSKVVKVTPDGTVTDAWTGLTAVTDVVLSPDGVLYAAEMSASTTDEPPYLTSGTGRIVRQSGPDSLEVVVDAIDAPVYLGFGPDGALYVTLPAFGANNGEGTLARVEMSGSGGAMTPATCTPMGTPTA